MKKRLFDNLGLKALSLAFAILLWFFISSKGKTGSVIDVKLEYINLPQSYEVLTGEPDTVRLDLFGNKQMIRGLQPEEVHVFVDLSDAGLGQVLYTIKREMIKLPGSIKVSKITPEAVKITIDKAAK